MCLPTAKTGLRWPRADEVRLDSYAFTLDDTDGWFHLYEWLRDTALVFLEGIHSDTDSIASFASDSPAYQRDIKTLRVLYREHARLFPTSFYANSSSRNL